MCYDTNARPPDPPGANGTAHGEDIELVSQDGTHFAAYYARADNPTARAQVLIYPDVRGLHDFYKALSMRFAEAGIDALAIDYFGRTAGMAPRDDSFEYMPHVEQMEINSFFSDVRAAVAYLREHSRQGSEPEAIFTLGFCMGGSLSMVSATQDLGQTAAIAFYAGLSRPRARGKSVLEAADQVRVPVLGLFGGADPSIPPSDIDKLVQGLDKAGVEHEIVVYPDAPHSFFDRKYEEFSKESADAWTRALDFIKGHSPSPSGE